MCADRKSTQPVSLGTSSHVGRGETGFGVQHPHAQRDGDGDIIVKFGILLFSIFLLVLAESIPTRSASTDSSRGASQYSVVPLGTPLSAQPQFAAFTKSAAGTAERRQAIVFTDERIEVIRVRRLYDIPPTVRREATICCSHGEGAPRVARAGTYVLIGSIDIEVGPLSSYDAWCVTLLAANGDVAHMRSDLILQPQRGPPTRERTVYVVGDISTVAGPRLSQNSTGSIGIIDLRLPTSKSPPDREKTVYQEHDAPELFSPVEIDRQSVEPAPIRTEPFPVHR
jgi:hypothetical protein